MLLRNLNCHGQIAVHLRSIIAHVHGRAAQNIRRPNQDRESHPLYELVKILTAGQLHPLRLVDIQRIHNRRELVTVLRPVDVARRSAEDGDMMHIQTDSQVVRNLASHRHYIAVRSLEVTDVEHTFQRQFLEIQPVADIIVRRYGFRVVVYHHPSPASLADGLQGCNRAPVKLDRRTDAVSSGAEHNHRTAVLFKFDVVITAVIGEIKIICKGREFCGKGIYLFDARHDAPSLSPGPYLILHCFRVETFLVQGTRYLMVRKALTLRLQQKPVWNVLTFVKCHQFAACINYVAQFMQEPCVYLRQFMNLLNGISGHQGMRYCEHPRVVRLAQRSIQIFRAGSIVQHEAVSTLSYHPQAFLQRLLEIATDSHHFPHTLHA